jgi:demethylmenaquinone methyltransferase/2-methoxy-6-polyprenyl-1,4-benzoquinol methylase
VLDVCAGTADIAIAVAQRGGRAVALDFALPMLEVGRRKARTRDVAFVEADALALPFQNDTFDAATIGFGLRNIAAAAGQTSAIAALLSEMARVVRPGGRVVSLETSRPPSEIVRCGYHVYLRLAVALSPLLSEGPAYRYLLRTVRTFPSAGQVADLFRAAGLTDVDYTGLVFEAAAIHTGRVPE